jgi:hypothetical protein
MNNKKSQIEDQTEVETVTETVQPDDLEIEVALEVIETSYSFGEARY